MQAQSTKSRNKRIQELAEDLFEEGGEVKYDNLTQLFNHLLPKLKFYIWKFFRNDCDTEDVLGNTVEKIISNLDSYKPKYRFTTWVYNIAKRESLLYIDKYKDSKTSGFNKDNNFYDMEEGYDSVELQYTMSDPKSRDYEVSFINDRFTDKYDCNDVYRLVIETIRNLPDDVNKSIIYDKKINHMKGKDIAKKYNMKENTVKTRLRKVTLDIQNILFSKYPELKGALII